MAITVEGDADNVVVGGWPGWSDWIFTMTFDHSARTERNEPSVVGMNITAVDGTDAGLDAESFRAVPFGALRRLAVGSFFDPFVALIAAEAQTERRPYGGGASHSEQVALIYRTALDQGFPPREAVARHFEKSPKTASRWIGEARRRGVLQSYEDEVAASADRMRPTPRKRGNQ